MMLRSSVYASLMLWFALCFAALPVSAATLSLVPTQASVELGSDVDIELWIGGLGNGLAPSVGAWSLDVVYSAELAFTSVDFGVDLGDELLFESFSDVNAVAGTVGLIQVSFLSTAALDALQSDSFLLGTLTFGAASVGNALLEIQNALVSDAVFPPGDISLLPSAPASVEVTVPIPEPHAALLFAYAWGLIGFSLRRRTRGDR